MAQRLATEYVKTCLVLNETQFSQLLQLFANHNLIFRVKVLDNGDQEVVFENASGKDSLALTFKRKQGKLVLEGSCRFTDMKLANAMRLAVSQFKGDAVVNRIYAFYTLEYRYTMGAVTRITERTKRGERLVYERKDIADALKKVLQNRNVESQIASVKNEIDHLLDRRNQCRDESKLKHIDENLSVLAHRLFILEA